MPTIIEINIHHRMTDDSEGEPVENDTWDSWQVSDTGGEFDDVEHADSIEADEDAEDREFHYSNMTDPISGVKFLTNIIKT
jgi:hypothetical protein